MPLIQTSRHKNANEERQAESSESAFQFCPGYSQHCHKELPFITQSSNSLARYLLLWKCEVLFAEEKWCDLLFVQKLKSILQTELMRGLIWVIWVPTITVFQIQYNTQVKILQISNVIKCLCCGNRQTLFWNYVIIMKTTSAFNFLLNYVIWLWS